MLNRVRGIVLVSGAIAVAAGLAPTRLLGIAET
jgi:hypothetical protein